MPIRTSPLRIPRFRWRATGIDQGARATDQSHTKSPTIAVHLSIRSKGVSVHNVYIGGTFVACVEGPLEGRREAAKQLAASLATAEAMGWRRPVFDEAEGGT